MEGDGAGSDSDMVNPHILSALVVDDDSVIRKVHEVHLKQFGLNAQVVEDGKEAVDLIQFGASFDLILMDMEMPIMDGPQATRELRAMGVTSIIVGVTSREAPSETQAFMEAGLDYCFGKPLTSDVISFLVEELNKPDSDDD